MLGTGARVSNVILKLMENKVMMQKSQEGRCFIEAQSSVHQRSFIIEVGRKISIQSHVLKNLTIVVGKFKYVSALIKGNQRRKQTGNKQAKQS